MGWRLEESSDVATMGSGCPDETVATHSAGYSAWQLAGDSLIVYCVIVQPIKWSC
jgi:hypothetical protein